MMSVFPAIITDYIPVLPLSITLSNSAFRCSEYFGVLCGVKTNLWLSTPKGPTGKVWLVTFVSDVNVLSRVDGFLPRGLYFLGKYPRGIE